MVHLQRRVPVGGNTLVEGHDITISHITTIWNAIVGLIRERDENHQICQKSVADVSGSAVTTLMGLGHQ